MAAESFFRLGKARQAEKCLEAALRLYGTKSESDLETSKVPFPQMQAFIGDLRQQIMGLRIEMRGFNNDDEGEDTPTVEQSLMVEEAETLDKSPRLHRKSLVGPAAPAIDLGPLSPALDRTEEKKDDLFE
jgi:hypothetical protein